MGGNINKERNWELWLTIQCREDWCSNNVSIRNNAIAISEKVSKKF